MIIIIIIIINNFNVNINIKCSTLRMTRPRLMTTNKGLLFPVASPSFSTRFVQMMNNYGATVLVPEVDSDLEVVLGKAFFLNARWGS